MARLTAEEFYEKYLKDPSPELQYELHTVLTHGQCLVCIRGHVTENGCYTRDIYEVMNDYEFYRVPRLRREPFPEPSPSDPQRGRPA